MVWIVDCYQGFTPRMADSNLSLGTVGMAADHPKEGSTELVAASSKSCAAQGTPGAVTSKKPK